MIPPNTRPDVLETMSYFFSVWSSDILDDIGPHLSCQECEALCDLLEVFGYLSAASRLRDSHSRSDSEGDDAQHLSIKAELERTDAEQQQRAEQETQ